MIKGEAIIKDNQTSLSINCEDCNVECFGGSDYEFIYTLDETNRRKLWRILRSKGLAGSMEDMIIDFFGICLDKYSFSQFCEENGIRFVLFTWIS